MGNDCLPCSRGVVRCLPHRRTTGDLRQIAEGIIGTNERLDIFRSEIKVQVDQVPTLISLPYTSLDGRVKTLESWKERTDRDPVEIVRERWGRPKAT
jgi:hypothetical protein